MCVWGGRGGGVKLLIFGVSVWGVKLHIVRTGNVVRFLVDIIVQYVGVIFDFSADSTLYF